MDVNSTAANRESNSLRCHFRLKLTIVALGCKAGSDHWLSTCAPPWRHGGWSLEGDAQRRIALAGSPTGRFGWFRCGNFEKLRSVVKLERSYSSSVTWALT